LGTVLPRLTGREMNDHAIENDLKAAWPAWGEDGGGTFARRLLLAQLQPLHSDAAWVRREEAAP
jgi:hypothetical protein